MEAEMIMGLAIISILAFIMVSLGVCQIMKKDGPVGFDNLIDPPKKDEITDVITWNKKHGIMWISYGICIELGFLLGYVMPIDAIKMIFMTAGIVVPLPFMFMRHKSLVKKYKNV